MISKTRGRQIKMQNTCLLLARARPSQTTNMSCKHLNVVIVALLMILAATPVHGQPADDDDAWTAVMYLVNNTEYCYELRVRESACASAWLSAHQSWVNRFVTGHCPPCFDVVMTPPQRTWGVWLGLSVGRNDKPQLCGVDFKTAIPGCPDIVFALFEL